MASGCRDWSNSARMPATNIEASACTRQIGSDDVNQRSPALSQISAAFAALSCPATRSRSVAIALRDRVAGQDNAAKAALIWDKAGERWFTSSDPIWRVHADASMFVAGIRALLLQSLHPLAMAGVAGHSGYKGDPWGRLQRTSTFLATT